MPEQTKVDLVVTLGDGTVLVFRSGDAAQLMEAMDLAAADEPNARGWHMAREPLEPTARSVTITGVTGATRHAPGATGDWTVHDQGLHEMYCGWITIKRPGQPVIYVGYDHDAGHERRSRLAFAKRVADTLRLMSS